VCVAADEFTTHQTHPECTAKADGGHTALCESVEAHVRLAITGDSAQRALIYEAAQVADQREHIFLRMCRTHKLRLRVGDAPQIADLFAALVYETRHLRSPLLLERPALEALCARCSNAISQFLVLIQCTKCAASINGSKLQQVTVGLLYMMRHGIRCNDTVLLPQITVLRNVLPLER
jgi:Zn finger protein HypA/HybF involved in hydrogenase expression